MIERTEAVKQGLRLSGLRKYPETNEALKELIDAIQSAPTIDAAAAMITDFVQYDAIDGFCPAPSQIRSALDKRKERPYEAPTRAAKCSQCADTGYRMERRAHRDDFYDFAVRCECKTRNKGVDSDASRAS
jgi:hypothetical protein